jgi:deferrochelatase/peroxidase EfeB
MSPLDRRQFLGRSAAAIGAGAVGLGVGAGVASGSTTQPSAEEAATRALSDELAARTGFDGYHQAGILTPRQTNAAFIALDAIAPRQSELLEGLKELSYRAAALTQGGDVAEIEIDDPPPDSGLLGSYNAPDGLTVTIAFGSTLFDGRYGLAATCCSRSAPTTATPSSTRCASCSARRPACSPRAGGSTVSRAPNGGRPSAAARATCSASATAPPTPTRPTRS